MTITDLIAKARAGRDFEGHWSPSTVHTLANGETLTCFVASVAPNSRGRRVGRHDRIGFTYRGKEISKARAIELLAEAAPPPAEKPELCYAAIESNAPGKRVVVIKRGECGYYETRDLDRVDAAIEHVRELVNELNAQLGVDRLEARAMLCGSMFGWNVPAANSDHQREAIAEANAIAANYAGEVRR